MAPKVPAKQPVKPKEKPVEKLITKKPKDKRAKKKNYSNFSIYLYKLLRQVSENKMGITKTSMLIMNNFIHDMMEKIANEAARLTSHGKRHTLSSREIQTAIKLLVPGELGKHSNMESMKAITTYHNNSDRE